MAPDAVQAVRKRGGTDLTARRLPWRAGLFGPPEAPLGAWLAKDLVERGDGAYSQVKVTVCWRTADGKAVGAFADGVVHHSEAASLAEAAYHGGVEALVPENGRIRQGFGAMLLTMLDALIHCTWNGHGDVDPAPWTECGATLSHFLATLDGEAVAWAQRVGLIDRIGASWHLMDRTFGNGSPLRACLDAWPWSRRIVLDLWEAHPDAAQLMDMADVHAWITDRLQGPPHRHPRHVARRHADACGAATVIAEAASDAGWQPEPLRDLRALRWLPASWVPEGDDWQPYLRLSRSLARMGNHLGDREAALRMVRLVDARGRWGELEARLCKAADMGPEGLHEALGDIHDVASVLSAVVIRPAWPGPAPVEGGTCDMLSFAAVTGSRNLCAALRISRAWHAAVPAMHAMLDALPGDRAATGWDPVLPRIREGDVEFVPLSTAAELRDEGAGGPDADGMAGLDHCVGTFAGACARNLCRIVSVRRATAGGGWERSSTAEVMTDDDGLSFAVGQHRGRGNAEPPPGDRSALAGYMASLGTPPTGGAFGPVQDLPAHINEAGYDPSWPGNHEAVSRWWDAFLAPPYKGLGRDDWARLLAQPRV